MEQKGRGNATYYIPTIKLLNPGINLSGLHIRMLSEGLTPHTIQLSEGVPDQIVDLSGELDLELREAIQKIGRRTPTEIIKSLIIQLCILRPFKPSDLAALLKRSHRYVRDYYLTPMVEAGELELLFPSNPAHPQQAYKSKKS